MMEDYQITCDDCGEANDVFMDEFVVTTQMVSFPDAISEFERQEEDRVGGCANCGQAIIEVPALGSLGEE